MRALTASSSTAMVPISSHQSRDQERIFHFDFSGWNLWLPDLDRFCFSGAVIDDLAIEGSRTFQSHMEEFPQQTQKFANAQAKILGGQSSAMASSFAKAWTSSVETLEGIPSAAKELWDESAEVYYATQRAKEQQQQGMVQ